MKRQGQRGLGGNRSMKRWVEVLGTMDQVEIIDRTALLRMDVRYVCTDFEEEVDIYEDRETGEFIGCES